MLATRRSTAFLRSRTPTTLAPLPRRLASSTTEQVKQSAARNRNTILGSAGALLAIYGVTVYFSGGQTSEKRRKAIQRIDRAKAAASAPSVLTEKASEAKAKSPSSDSSSPPTSTSTDSDDASDDDQSQEAAFNPETGEINWDCPCLGGMAHGTCGDHFKAAFSCFVFSEAEPKGIDCVDKFQEMQACFRENPKEYEQVIDDTAALEAEVDAEPGNADHGRLRTAESQGRGKGGGPGPLESISQSASDVAGAASSAYDGAKSMASGDGRTETEVKQSKTKQRAEGGGPLRQPTVDDDGHKSKSSPASASNPSSGHDEKAQFMADGHGSSDKFQGTGVGRGKDSLDSEKTTNITKGERDPLGRNAASGSKPSGSTKAHEKHKEGVEKTRSGEESQSSKERLINRG